MSTEPPDLDQGLFFLARASNLAGSNREINSYGREQCLKHYDSDRAWPALIALTKTHATPPPGFTIVSLKR